MNRRIVPVVELATLLITLSVIVGFGRLFTDWSFARELVAIAVGAHAIAIVSRRLQLGLILSSLTSALGLVVIGSAVFFSDTTRFGFVPTGATRIALRADLDAAWTAFQDVTSPAMPIEGFVVTAALGIWLIAYLIDWAAFRLDSVVESVLPALALFGFQTFMGANQHQAIAVATFAGSVLFFVLAHRTSRFELDGTWLGDNANPGTSALLRIGTGLAALTVLAGALIGPGLPGAGEEALIEIDPGGGGGGTRIAINPLVEIRSQLVDLPDTVAFVATTPESGEYWKLASLDDFNGSEWTLGDDFDDASGVLESGEPGGLETDEVIQTIQIEALASDWLPAMYQPIRFDSSDLDAEWDSNTGSLLVENGRPLERGDRYTVISGLPNRSRAQVENATGAIPELIASNNLQLPDGFSPLVTEEAERVVNSAGAVTPYEQARALQDYFRNGFRYDLDVVKGHSNERIEDFLFDSKAGYCEQFAGSYAAMARSLGLPTRVAVGFTSGERIAGTDAYRVRGANAHAWPEVWFADVGWVSFEPTPGRGSVRNQDVTGVPPQPPETAPPVSSAEDDVPQTVPVSPRQTIPEDLPPDLQAAPGAPSPASGFSIGPWAGRFLLVLAVGAVLAGLRYLLIAAKKRHRERFRGDPQHSREVVLASWQESVQSAGVLGVERDAAESPAEVARRASSTLGASSEPFAEIASLATAAQYSPNAPSMAAADRAAVIADGLREQSLASMGRVRRVLDELNPAPLLVPTTGETHRPDHERQAVTVGS